MKLVPQRPRPLTSTPSNRGSNILEYYTVRGDPRVAIQLRRLLCLTHVCRTWRTLALDLAELWGDVAFASRNPAALPVLLERAYDAPLIMTLGANPLQEHLVYISEHPERLRLLETRRVQWNPTALAGKTLPYLEAAVLVPGPQHAGHHPDMLPVYMPRLEELTLNRFYIPFVAPVLRDLFVYGLRPFDPAVMVSMLNALPALTSLKLDNCLPTSLEGTADVGRIELPRISHIDLRQSTCGGLITFLELLRPNGSDMTISLSLGYVSRSSTDFVDLAKALQPFMRGTSLDTIDMNFDIPDYTPQPTFAIYRSSGHRGEERMSGIVIRVEDYLEDVKSLFAALLEQLSVNQIRHLGLFYGENTERNTSSEDLLRLLQISHLAKSIQTLRQDVRTTGLRERFAEFRIAVLLFDRPMLWPRLNELTLSEDACLYVLADHAGASRLLSWLKARVAVGSPLTLLRLQGHLLIRDRSQMESSAELHGVWEAIRAMVKVVDEWSILERDFIVE
ncbi:hypothetical protein PENSPDRAFT_739733 [Peniophora sp. CONT]|nr:hypothetical protein PENSPDRAFT_739733 [Peniophora sp. CONT]